MVYSQLVNLRLDCEPLFLYILHLHPLCEPLDILYGELRIFLYTTDSDPHRDESDLESREIVLEIQQIILGPVGRDIDIVVRIVLYDMLHWDIW